MSVRYADKPFIVPGSSIIRKKFIGVRCYSRDDSIIDNFLGVLNEFILFYTSGLKDNLRSLQSLCTI